MNKKKSIAVAIVLTLILLIGGMIAYFTDEDTATNQFTLGDNIEISLSETGGWTNTAGSTNWTNTNAQGIHLGTTVTKAPSIHNDSTTTPAYVFAEVIVPCYASTGTTANTPLFTFTNNSGWELINTPSVDTTNKTIKYVYAYATNSVMTTLAANTSTTTSVFDSVTLEPTLTAEQKATVTSSNIVVNAYGIQTDGLGTNSTPSQIFALFSNN